jgi:hypothetical protein
VFDYEVKNSYNIRVQTNDGRGGTYQEQFTINVTDVNDAPTNITLSSNIIVENQPAGTTVGIFATTDVDGGPTYTYTLVSGIGSTNNGSFTITGNTLKTNAVFDHETKSSYSIRVQTDDGRGAIYQKVFTINVTNVNEAPTNITLSKSNIAENKPVGTVVATFTTTDVDGGPTYTYMLVSGEGDSDNVSFTIVGSTLKTNALFNYETKSSYSILVRTNDGHGGTFERQFTIDVTDVNEAPTNITLSSSSIAENQPSGTEIGTFTTTDEDGGPTYTYRLVGDKDRITDNASFTIVGNMLKARGVFNYEGKRSYTIRVQTSDGRGGTYQKQFTIRVTDVNEAPTSITLSNNRVTENRPLGTRVGTFRTTDVDGGPTYTYILDIGIADNDLFTLEGNTLETNAMFDYHVRKSYSIRVQTDDGRGGASQKTFSIYITSVSNYITSASRYYISRRTILSSTNPRKQR